MKDKNMNNEYLMAIDLGTTTVKVGIFCSDGVQIAFESDEYMLSYLKRIKLISIHGKW